MTTSSSLDKSMAGSIPTPMLYSLTYSADLDIEHVGRACANYITNSFRGPEPAKPTAWQIDLSIFITEVLMISGFEPAVAILSLLLVHRCHTQHPSLVLEGTDCHKLFLSAFITSTKVLHDGGKRLDWWCMVCGYMFEVKDLIGMEVEFLNAVDWRLNFDTETFDTFVRLIRRHAGRVEGAPVMQKVVEVESETVSAVEECLTVSEMAAEEADSGGSGSGSACSDHPSGLPSPPMLLSPPPPPLTRLRPPPPVCPPVRCTPPRRGPDSVDTIPTVHSSASITSPYLQPSLPFPIPPLLSPGPNQPVPVSWTIALPPRMTADLSIDSDCTMWNSTQKGIIARLLSMHWTRLVLKKPKRRGDGASRRSAVGVGMSTIGHGMASSRRRVSGDAFVNPRRKHKWTLRSRFFGVFL